MSKTLTLAIVVAVTGIALTLGAGFPQGTTANKVTPQQFDQWKKDLNNWNRWGKDDEIGTMNLITPAKRKQAAALVKEGFSVSPVAVGDKLFFTNDEGQTFVVQAGATFKLLRTNELKARVLASPALVDGIWYWRTDKELLAIGK